MKKSLIIFIILILSLIILTGCWSEREINTLGIVEAVGIDKTENGEILLTFQILKPSAIKSSGGNSSGGGQESAVTVLSSTGETVFDAIRNATEQSCKRLYFPFNKIIIIGEDAARDGIGDITEFFDRNRESRSLAYILVAKGRAKDIIEASSEQEKVPAKGIEMLLDVTYATSQRVKMTLNDIHKILACKTSSPYTTGIKTLSKQTKDGLITVTELEDTAIFKKDKLIGWVGKKETRGFLWILGKVENGIIVINSPGEEDKKVSLQITSSSVKVEPEIKDGKLFVNIKIKEQGYLGEQMSQYIDLTKPEPFKELEIRQAAAIKSEVNAALDQIQKGWGVDIFRFCKEFHSKYPEEWKELEKNWDEEIKNITVNVEVEAKINSVGMSTYPESYKGGE